MKELTSFIFSTTITFQFAESRKKILSVKPCMELTYDVLIDMGRVIKAVNDKRAVKTITSFLEQAGVSLEPIELADHEIATLLINQFTLRDTLRSILKSDFKERYMSYLLRNAPETMLERRKRVSVDASFFLISRHGRESETRVIFYPASLSERRLENKMETYIT